jgi:PKHD-type hydroxylase
MTQRMLWEIPPFSSPGKDDFCYWEGFLDDSDINHILARSEWHNQSDAQVGGGFEGQVNKEKRRTNVSWMFPDQNNQHIWEKITNTIWTANRQFFRFDLRGCYEAMQLGVYTEHDQGHYDWHIDSGLETNTVPRKLSMALLLSDPSEFEGGQLQVMRAGVPEPVEQKRGRAWFFPSYLMHRVTPVTKGIRRSLVMWVGGPAFV